MGRLIPDSMHISTAERKAGRFFPSVRRFTALQIIGLYNYMGRRFDGQKQDKQYEPEENNGNSGGGVSCKYSGMKSGQYNL